MTLTRSLTLKRALDLVIASTALALLAPVLVGVAAAIALINGRPILLRQQRPGLHGRPFKIFKFRTMSEARDEDGGLLPDEQRLTRFGRSLRAMSLDELPELFNVLRGDMSLVGPRPLLMEYVPLYSSGQARRHEVKPGITGWAQVHGRNAISWEKRFALDVWYVDHWSVWLDLRIIAVTAVKVLQQEGISPPGHVIMPKFRGSLPGAADAAARAAESFAAPARPRRAIRIRRAAPIIGSGLAAALSLAGFVGLIDPYGITNLVTIPGVNAEKTRRLDGGGRVERSLRLWLFDHETLILGGSAAQSGLDPAGPTLARLKAYNAALPGATMPEVAALGRFALNHEPLRRVIFGVDFGMFEGDRTSLEDFESSGFDGDWMPMVLVRSLLMPRAVIDAVQTIHDNLRGRQTRDRADGFLDSKLLPASGYNYRQAFMDEFAKLLIKPWHYADFDYDPRRFEVLSDFLRQTAEAGLDTYVFVRPMHASQLEAIRAMNILPVFERWLQDLVITVEQVNFGAAVRRRVELWNFSGYNSITMEDVPDAGDQRDDMLWYLSSSHFTATAGELILARMLGSTAAEIRVPADFGSRLDHGNLENVLASMRGGHADYARSYPEEVADVQRLVIETADEREHELKACCG